MNNTMKTVKIYKAKLPSNRKARISESYTLFFKYNLGNKFPWSTFKIL